MLKFANRNLKTFFIIIATFILLASVIISFFFIKSYRVENKNIAFNNTFLDISSNLINLRKAVISFKNAEHPDEFYTYKKDVYSDKIYILLYRIKNSTEKLNKLNSENNFEITTLLNEIDDISENFETDFKLLTENIQKLGNSGNGYYEHIIQTEHKTQKILNAYPNLKKQFQHLIKLKFELLNTGEPETEDTFLKAKSVFLTSLKTNQTGFNSTTEKQIVIDNTADWFNTVFLFFKIKKINGTSYYSGLFDNLETYIQAIENNIFKIQKINLSLNSRYTETHLINFILFLTIFTLILILSVFGFYLYVKKTILSINKSLSEFVSTETDKINKFTDFQQAKKYIELLKEETGKKTEFINDLISGNYSEYQHHLKTNDILGTALINLNNTLIKEEEKRATDEQLKAVSDRQKDGIVKFGKIIRRNFGNSDALFFELLTELVRFLDADIGGIYIIDKNTAPDILTLKASYAYNEKKIINKEIKIGEGLVGTCAADKSSIYIDKIDDDYIKIVSGFGYTKPKSLLLAPIYVEDEVFGVIELASSKTFSQYDIEFIETLSEDIAYTLAYLLKK